jgi:mycothiol system anti-sigma-R factor
VSCGNHHDTDCAEVLAEVWLFLDHECDAARRALLAQHLEECGPCLAEYGLDEKLKTLLATKCGGEHAPPGLKDRLRRQIRTAVLEQADVVEQTELTVEARADGTTTTVEIRSVEVRERRG